MSRAGFESPDVAALAPVAGAVFSLPTNGTSGRGLVPQAQAPSAAPLGNNADFASGLDRIHEILPPPATVKGFYLRSLGRDILRNHGVSRRMRWCGSRIARNKDGVGLYARPDRAYGRVHGVCVCGQSICCPVCAPRIASFRANEVAVAFERASNAGWVASLETFTKPHSRDMRPGALLREFKEFSALWRRFQSGRMVVRREKGAKGHHLGREINWGAANGWHYHHHRLRYDLPDTFDPLRAKADWLSVLQGVGYSGPGLDLHAYDCGAVGTEAGARYVAKMATSVEASCRAIGSEIASAVTKGRNINSLLADHGRGDLQAGAIWLNGVADVTASKVASVRWSRGLKYALGMDDASKTDEQIAEEEALPSDVFLGALLPRQWSGVLKWRAEFALCCAANNGLDAVNEFLTGLGLGQLNEEAPAPVFTPDSGEYVSSKHKSDVDL